MLEEDKPTSSRTPHTCIDFLCGTPAYILDPLP